MKEIQKVQFKKYRAYVSELENIEVLLHITVYYIFAK